MFSSHTKKKKKNTENVFLSLRQKKNDLNFQTKNISCGGKYSDRQIVIDDYKINCGDITINTVGDLVYIPRVQ